MSFSVPRHTLGVWLVAVGVACGQADERATNSSRARSLDGSS